MKHGVSLVWTTSRGLSFVLGFLSLVAGVIPAAAAWVGKLIVDAVVRAAAGCDVVFHVAARVGAWGPRAEYWRTNVTGTENVVGTLTFAGFLAYYAHCVWWEKRPAVALGAFYALYVLVNLVLWTYRKPDGAERPLFFLISYTVGALGVAGGAALLLQKYKDRYA